MQPQGLRTDDRIKHDIIDALAADSRLDAGGIDVDVIGGTIYLTGVIPSLVQKRLARQVVGRIKGVLDVDDELKVVPVTARSDAEIEWSITASLTRDVLIDETKIETQVTNGVAKLIGVVDSFAAKRAVEDIAWSTHGVTDVMDHLIIESHSPREDAEIARDIQLQLDRNIKVGPEQVHLKVHDGVVQLDGQVSTMAQMWIIEELTRWVPGVVDVENNLDVE